MNINYQIQKVKVMRKMLVSLGIMMCSTTFSQSIYGTAKNASEDITLSLRTIHKKQVKKIPLQGTKFNTGDLEIREGYYIFRKNSSTVTLYLKPEFNLEINFDAKDFRSTIGFSGKGAEVNNYLLAKKKLLRQRWKDVASFYKGDENDYLKKIKSIDKEIKTLLNKVSDESFKKNELLDLRFSFLHDVYNYPDAAKYQTGKEVTVHPTFFNEFNSIDFNNSTFYNLYPAYKSLVSDKWNDDLKKAKSFEEMDAKFSKIRTNQLYVDVLVNALYRISDTPEQSKAYYKLILKYVTNQEFVSKAKEKYNKIKSTGIGKKSPNFTFEDRNGKKVSLKDFRGKYVLIDIWATWCTPCLRELPHLKKLEVTYHDKNIEFIGISVDYKSEYDLWKKMLKEKELNGIQLFSDNAFDSDFVSDFGVSSIPRFILISPEGKIAESHLSKPSKEKTKQLLNKLLN